MGGQFESIAGPAGTIEFDIPNLIGNQYYVPLITNTRSTAPLLGVNMGLQKENRCECDVSPNTSEC
jgi:hypothetical protein